MAWTAMAAASLAGEEEDFQKLADECKMQLKSTRILKEMYVIHVECGKQFEAFASGKSGEVGDRALIEALGHYGSGKAWSEGQRVIEQIRKRDLSWENRIYFAHHARWNWRTMDLAVELADEIAEKAGDDFARVKQAIDFYLNVRSRDDAIAFARKAIDNPHFSDEERELLKVISVAVSVKPGGDPIPFEAESFQTGERISLEEYRGKLVLLDFWSTWCAPCVFALPEMKRAYSAFHDRGFEIIGISLDQDLDRLRKYIKDEKLTWPQIADGNGWDARLAKLYYVRQLPRTILIGLDGKIVAMNLTREHLYQAVEAAMK
jgi:peroxiredoxin